MDPQPVDLATKAAEAGTQAAAAAASTPGLFESLPFAIILIYGIIAVGVIMAIGAVAFWRWTIWYGERQATRLKVIILTKTKGVHMATVKPDVTTKTVTVLDGRYQVRDHCIFHYRNKLNKTRVQPYIFFFEGSYEPLDYNNQNMPEISPQEIHQAVDDGLENKLAVAESAGLPLEQIINSWNARLWWILIGALLGGLSLAWNVLSLLGGGGIGGLLGSFGIGGAEGVPNGG